MAASFNHYPQMAKVLHQVASQAVRKTVADIQAAAQQRAPVDTGFLRSSVYTVTSAGSSYGSGAGTGPLLPEIPAAENDTTGYVAVGAEYGVYLEYGTSHGPAQPYLTPASEEVRPSFEQAMARVQAAFDEAGG